MDRAHSTVRKYSLSYYKWCRWIAKLGLKPIPADGCYFALYLSELISKANSPSPVIAAVYGVSWAHRKAGCLDPASHPLVVQAVDAAKRLLAQPVSRKEPIKVGHLKEISRKFDRPGMSLKDLQTLLIILVGFAGFLRWSDLSGIKIENIQILPSHMSIFLEKRKNDQFRKGQYVDIARFQKLSFCPVDVMERFLAHSHLERGLLLTKTRGSGTKLCFTQTPLPYHQARKQVLAMIAGIGLNPKKFGLHSLRSGGATTAASRGARDRSISRHGGWRSSFSRNCYIEDDTTSRLALTHLFDN